MRHSSDGYCTPGMLMTAKSLLARSLARPKTRYGTTCAATCGRCTGYASIVRAVLAGSGIFNTKTPRHKGSH